MSPTQTLVLFSKGQRNHTNQIWSWCQVCGKVNRFMKWPMVSRVWIISKWAPRKMTPRLLSAAPSIPLSSRADFLRRTWLPIRYKVWLRPMCSISFNHLQRQRKEEEKEKWSLQYKSDFDRSLSGPSLFWPKASTATLASLFHSTQNQSRVCSRVHPPTPSNSLPLSLLSALLPLWSLSPFSLLINISFSHPFSLSFFLLPTFSLTFLL